MKTGGFSLLYQVLANVARDSVWGAPRSPVGDDQMERYTSVALLQALDAEARSAIEVVIGHLPFAAVALAGFPRATVVTVVREPVERTLSFLAMCAKTYPEHRGLALEQVYEDEFFRPRLMANHQVKMLGMSAEEATTGSIRVAGPPHPDVVATLMAEGYFETARYVMEVLDTPLVRDVTVDGVTLDRARRNLESLDLLGLHERYDEFLDGLARLTGWTIDPAIRVNRGDPVAVAPSFRRRIEADNALDLALYEHAREVAARA